ncbi:MAG: hypothetical protein HY680_06870 [Chloroflexi bacterium]|nr:hypothetical protein [Chloroflexota bacterium]
MSKRLWGMDLEAVWLPFLRQAKAQGVLEIEDEVLDNAIREGKVHPEILRAVDQVKANFESALVMFGRGFHNYHLAQLVRR